MKISCLPVAMFPRFLRGETNISEWACEGYSIGLEGIDVSTHFFTNHSPAHLFRLKRELEKIPVEIVMVAAYPDFTNPDSRQRQREFTYLCRDIALASELGARYVRVLAGQNHPGIEHSEGVRNAVSFLVWAAEVAAYYDIQLVYENHSKPSAWLYEDFSYRTDIFLEIAESVSGSGVKVNFDTANVAAYGGDTLKLLARVIHLVETVHVADTSTRGKLTPTRIGSGIAPIGEVFSMLKSKGFDGWLCIEDCVSNDADGLRESVQTVRDLWEKA